MHDRYRSLAMIKSEYRLPANITRLITFYQGTNTARSTVGAWLGDHQIQAAPRASVGSVTA